MLTGVVLAGGKSRRYGKNKALEVFRGKRLIDLGVESLRTFCDPVLVVANDLNSYLDVQATLVEDFVPDQGPLGGIYTSLLFSPHEWVFVRATDMPVLVPELTSLLMSMKEGFDVVVPKHDDNKYEPLTALYNKRCIAAIARLLERSERQTVKIYKAVKVRYVSEKKWRAADPTGSSFANVNTPQDWDKLGWTFEKQ